MLVVKKLREDEELLAQELVGEINGRVDNTRPMCADRVGHVADADRVEVLTATWFLDKELVVQIVAISVLQKKSKNNTFMTNVVIFESDEQISIE